jgi:hypothetical protein
VLVFARPGRRRGGLAVDGADALAVQPSVFAEQGTFFRTGCGERGLVCSESGALARYALVLIACLTICAIEGSLGKMLPPMVWTFCLAAQMWPDVIGLRQASALLRSRQARYFGTISYCLYLLNEPIHKVTGDVLSRFADGDGRLFTVLWIPPCRSFCRFCRRCGCTRIWRPPH